jgi:DNA polymerase-3 subunit alpha
MFDICSKTDYLKIADIDWDDVDLEDPEVWQLFHEGKTKGIFQLESNAGRSWSKKLKPDNIEELSALVAILRPGALKAIVKDEEGKKKSITQRYVDRKHGLEKVTYIHDSCREILQPTQGLMLYQEQTMKIATVIAGFSGVEADKLRKAIGKKDAELMTKIRKWFIEGCEKTGIVDTEKANEIYDIIEKSARYQFNKCLSPDTVVETKDGFKLLSEVKIGDYVLAPKNNEENEFVEVLDVIDNGEKDIYEVELDDGKIIKCTLDHKFLCEDGNKYPLIEIIENDYKIMCID